MVVVKVEISGGIYDIFVSIWSFIVFILWVVVCVVVEWVYYFVILSGFVFFFIDGNFFVVVRIWVLGIDLCVGF